MKSIASRFGASMSKIDSWVDLIAGVVTIGGDDASRLRSAVPMAQHARDLHAAAAALGHNTVVIAYEGAFLAACAEFELAIRDMVERFVAGASAAKPAFTDLPSAMQKRQHFGCAKVMQYIDRPRFSHLTIEDVVECLYTCHPNSAATTYRLLPEAFSENERNFSWSMTKEVIDRLGIRDPLQLIGKDPAIAANLKLQPGGQAANMAQNRLDEMMRRRNLISHRGRTVYSPSASDVKECAAFLAAFAEATANVLAAHLASL